MADSAATRIPVSISTAELERRWKATRSAMQEKNLDFLLMQNSADYMGGYVKWFTDLPAVHNFPSTVIFPRAEEMTTIWHGAPAPREPNPPAWALRGVKKRISVPNLPSLAYTNTYDAEQAVAELLPHGKCRIGLVGLGQMPASFYKYLTGHLTAAVIEDASDLVDEIKAVKSEEEFDHIRKTCEIQDAAFAYALTRIQPGRRDWEVLADVKHKCLALGSEQQLIIGGSAPAGTRVPMFHSHYGNRVIAPGDQFYLLIECNGPSGFYAHLARIVSLGEVPSEVADKFELARTAQQASLALLKPGADPVALWDSYNAFLRSQGYPEEGRIFAHSQGYDLVERPSLNPGETIRIQGQMNISVHPGIGSATAFANVCENYRTFESREPECLHKTPQQLFVV